MPTERSERIKQCIVILLAVTAVAVAYFRFFHKPKAARVDGVARPQPEVKVDLQEIEKSRPLELQAARFPVDEFLSPDIRDIFEPGLLPPEPAAEKKKEAAGKSGAGPKPAPSIALDLQGTIVAGKKSLAIINNKFFRVGEKIGGYRIVAIAPNTVYLKAGRHQKVIRVLDDDKK